jgi:hypothetical protein
MTLKYLSEETKCKANQQGYVVVKKPLYPGTLIYGMTTPDLNWIFRTISGLLFFW